MSRAGDEEDKDENECFHDSLDRLLSCSNTSCSCSPSNSDFEDDDCGPSSASSSDDTGTVPKFPLGVSRNFDVWVSQPSSVEDRRLHLLRQMGLAGDPTLLRHRPSLSFSLSSYHPLNPLGETCCSTNSSNSKTLENNSNCVKGCDDNSDCDGTAFGMARSKSDVQCDSRRTFPAQSDGTVSGGTGLHVINQDKGKNIQRHSSAERSSSSNISLDTCTVSPNKLPKVKSINYGSNHNRSFSDTHPPFSRDEEFCSLDRDGLGDVKSLCKIKNLNNGKEFVVDEMREDGTWKKIKEVGIGHHLMMDDLSSEMYVGTSPIVQELMRRQHFEDRNKDGLDSNKDGGVSKSKKRGSWLKNMKNVANSITGHKERSSDERDTSSEKGGRRSSSATDDSQDVSFHGFERVRVKHYGKSVKELTALYKSQEIRAHNGSIWAVQFSLDGKYLASAGEDSVIQVWQVVETESKEDFFFHKLEDGNFNLLFPGNGLPEQSSMSPNLDGHPEKKKIRRRLSISRKSMSFEQILVPEKVFGLSEKPLCSFHGHLDDVLDLAWSKSLQLLSSSMDKTVRLWDLSSKSCLKIFSHSDYVTCIQFNPVDDRYFISGSLDAKVRIWSIPDRKVVDWNDLHEMVTAACYTPDGQGALVGSYKGSCRLYNISENKLLRKSQINLQNGKKKSHQKKITGFQFAPGSASEVLVTSADSRVRVIDGVDFVHKFKGFHNTNSQISASVTSNGKYIISASEDSYVYVWRHEAESRPNRTKGVTMTQTYEYFHCQDVSVAIPWPGPSDKWAIQDSPAQGLNDSYHQFEDSYTECHPPTVAGETNCSEGPSLGPLFTDSPLNGPLSCAPNTYFFDKMSMTWPEEKLPQASLKNRSPRVSIDFSNGLYHQNRSAWGMVIVTAGLKGEIKIFQNFGLPMRT